MFTIEKYNNEKPGKIPEHNENIFHEALTDGDCYYHVHNGNGQDYDIEYKRNSEYFAGIIPGYAGEILPDYRIYDENDVDSLDIEYLNSHSQYIMIKVTEYSIAVARAVLKFTDKHVYFTDPRALWFLEAQSRLHIGKMPIEDDNTIFLVGALGNGYTKGKQSDNKKSDIFVFDSLFFIQFLLSGKKTSQVKYMSFPETQAGLGIGGLLIQLNRLKSFAGELGWQLVYNKEHLDKFKVSYLKKFINIEFSHEGCTDENTVIPAGIAYFNWIWRYNRLHENSLTGIFTENFRSSLDEYASATVGGRKSLGILIRGTDYKKVGFSGARVQASVEEMIPLIDEWMAEGHYDIIFLATEDAEVLETMRRKYGHSLITTAQERHKSSEFRQGQIISELERELYADDEYDAHVMDTNINYLYALYLLSQCDAFMCSGQNNGWDMVRLMNEGKFKKSYRFAVDQINARQ